MFPMNKFMKFILHRNILKVCFGCIWRRVFSDNVAEWQIEAVKTSAKTLKDEEVEHSEMAPAEKENQKRLWKR